MVPEMSQWLHYHRNLAGETVAFHEGEVESGYYRTRKPYRQGWGHPVAFWRERGRLIGFEGRTQEPMTRERIIDAWVKVCCFPISYEVYLAVCQGEEWQDSSIRKKAKGETKVDKSDDSSGNYRERKSDPYAPQVNPIGDGKPLPNGTGCL